MRSLSTPAHRRAIAPPARVERTESNVVHSVCWIRVKKDGCPDAFGDVGGENVAKRVPGVITQGVHLFRVAHARAFVARRRFPCQGDASKSQGSRSIPPWPCLQALAGAARRSQMYARSLPRSAGVANGRCVEWRLQLG